MIFTMRFAKTMERSRKKKKTVYKTPKFNFIRGSHQTSGTSQGDC